MPNLNVGVDEDELSALRAWKRRYADHLGVDPEAVTWTDLLLAYANSKVMP